MQDANGFPRWMFDKDGHFLGKNVFKYKGKVVVSNAPNSGVGYVSDGIPKVKGVTDNEQNNKD